MPQDEQAGTLRVGFNLNNAALVQKSGENYFGLAPQLARQIAQAAALELIPVDYPNARSAVEAVGTGWDIAFLAFDPARADRMLFSAPYHSVTATFALRADHNARSCAEVLSSQTSVASPKGAAFHSRLIALPAQGPVLISASPAEAIGLFKAGEAEALAGIRDTLIAENLIGCRILEDDFAQIEQAVALAPASQALLPLINRLLATSA